MAKCDVKARGTLGYVGVAAKVGAIALLVGAGWMAWTSWGDRHRPEPPWAVRGEISAESGRDRTYEVHLAFQQEDCPSTHRELERVAAEAKEIGLPVKGVFLHPGVGGPDGKELDEALPFPVQREEGGSWTRLLRSLGFRRTPIALLVDDQGRLHSAVPGDETRALTEIIDHAEFIQDSLR